MCKVKTKEALTKPNAFEKMDNFFSEGDYEGLRNYEIEDYLDNITGKYGHKINELCPYNGFMWFD